MPDESVQDRLLKNINFRKKTDQDLSFFASFFRSDRSINETLYRESKAGSIYFAIAGILLYSFMFYYNFSIMPNPINMALRVVNIVCCVGILIVLRKFKTQKAALFTNLLLMFITLAEIESQHHELDVKFYAIETWIGYPIILLFDVFFFFGSPKYFIVLWGSILIAYFLRALIPQPAGIHETKIIFILLYSAALTLLSILLNMFWYRIRFNGEMNLRKLQDANIQIKTANEQALAEQKLRFESETELATAREREKVFADIHDHLGARLTDLIFLGKKIKPGQPINFEIASEINQCITQIRSDLRNRLLSIEDYKLLLQGFVQGLHLNLIRRYTGAGREISFDIKDKEIIDNFMKYPENETKRDALIAGIREITTNDLKYGREKSRWEISLSPADPLKLMININSKTIYDINNKSPGLGSKTIEQRIGDVGGEISSVLKDGMFSIRIEIPVKL